MNALDKELDDFLVKQAYAESEDFGIFVSELVTASQNMRNSRDKAWRAVGEYLNEIVDLMVTPTPFSKAPAQYTEEYLERNNHTLLNMVRVFNEHCKGNSCE